MFKDYDTIITFWNYVIIIKKLLVLFNWIISTITILLLLFTTCSDLAELCLDLIESNVAAWHSSDNAVRTDQLIK